MRSHAERVQETVNSISMLIESKSAKKRYLPNTGLVVYYDDYTIWYEQEDYDLLRSAVYRLRPKWKGTFDAIFVVGPRGDVLIEVEQKVRIFSKHPQG